MYKFGKARILAGLPPGLGDDQRWTIVMLSNQEEEIAMQERFPKWNRVHTFRAMPHRFARLIAKIGQGYATAEVGIGSIQGAHKICYSPILGLLRLLCGWKLEYRPGYPGGNHVTDISFRFTSSHTAWGVVHIRLFSAAETPNYHVVVGEIDLSNADHLQTFEKHRLNGKLTLTRSS